MNRIKGRALGLGVPVLMVVVAACVSGGSSATPDTSSSAILFENTSGDSVEPQSLDEPDTEPDVVRQDESAALTADAALAAKQRGLPVESVERAIAFQQAFGKYADELIARFPDQISAVWMEPMPNTRGHVQFTGGVPPEVTSEIARQGLLDPNNVIITGEGMISMADHARRAELAAEALEDLGYRNFITFFDAIDKVIRVELQLPEGASQPSKLDLVGAVSERRGSVSRQSSNRRCTRPRADRGHGLWPDRHAGLAEVECKGTITLPAVTIDGLFVFLALDVETGAIPFVGRVADPGA